MKKTSDKNKEEILKELKDGEEALRSFRFGIAGSKIKNVRDGRNIRRNIARLKTSLNKTQKI